VWFISICGCATGPAAKSGGEWPQIRAGCRADGEKEQVPAGLKRFELRIARGVDATTITIDGRRALVRGTVEQPAETCAYVDLAPGEHALSWREEAKTPEVGIQPMLAIAEYGPAVNAWYHTLEVACTTAEGCLKDDMHAAIEKLGAVPRGLHDPCGSTRVKGLRWAAEHSPSVKLEDATVELTLHVYGFATKHPPGSAECHHTVHGE
jgi:hypothetical protein